MCDGKAAECSEWEDHCHAYPSQMWKNQRAVAKLEKAQKKQQMELEKQSAVSGIVQTASGSGCQCTTRFDSNILNWTFTRKQQRVLYTTGKRGLHYIFKAMCRKCRKVPPPATKKTLLQNLYGNYALNLSTKYIKNYIPFSGSSSTTWASYLQQRKDLESKLLKSFVEGDESLLRETEMTGMCLGHDVTARWAHPLWSREDVSVFFLVSNCSIFSQFLLTFLSLLFFLLRGS